MPEPQKSARGGARPGAGRKKTERPTNSAVATAVLAEVKVKEKWKLIIAIETEKAETKGVTSGLRETLKYLENRSLGNCVDTVNHLHDKPLEMNVQLSLGEGMRIAMEKAEQRVRARQ
jgi:hypothetical protein